MRDRSHIIELLNLNSDSQDKEQLLTKYSETILQDLKRIYDNSIKPLEQLYKYRDLSNRHYGDAEIFSKPLVVFMGPWSGGKSTILNYLTNNEYSQYSIRSGKSQNVHSKRKFYIYFFVYFKIRCRAFSCRIQYNDVWQ